MTVRPFEHLPEPGYFSTFKQVMDYTRRLRDALVQARRGKLECVVEFSLATGTTSTVLTDPRLTIQSVLVFDPKTVAAATELYAGTLYCLTANRGTGTWTYTHSIAATARDFQVAIIG